MFYLVSPIGIVRKDSSGFIYSCPDHVPNGSIVEIPVGKKTMLGIITKKVFEPKFKCREILRVLFLTPIPETLLKLNNWMSEYYSTHPGIVWQTILPSGLNKVHRKKDLGQKKSVPRGKKNTLTSAQKIAYDKIKKNLATTTLLRGITGSGKTEIYKKITHDVLNKKESVILLVPEISLTSQLVSEFQNDFDNVILTHSKMTATERQNIWKYILELNEPFVIIGPRSALFLPVQNLGQIIIDECHEPSYRQDGAPKYNALRVAAKLAEFSGAKLLLGSATPSVMDYYLAERANAVVNLDKLAIEIATPATIKIVNLTEKQNRGGLFPEVSLDKIKKAIEKNCQVLVFHNRRGSASFVLCEKCGWTANCPNCVLPLTPHNDKFQLKCHTCGYAEKLMMNCPECRSPHIIQKGIGTKKIEEELRAIFPKTSIARFDGDNKKGMGVHDRYGDLRSGKIQIIIGTQAIAKGLDLPRLSLVVIPSADTGLNMPDFSARERTFQLLTQAIGRVGRHSDATEVIVQTYQPDNPVIQFGVKQDFLNFYKYELGERSRGHFPPFMNLLKFTNSYKTEAGAINAAQKSHAKLKIEARKKTIICNPTPSFYEKTRDHYHWQIIVKAKSRRDLQALASIELGANWQTDLDPNSLI